MSRSNDLRKLVQSQLKTVCDKVYYRQADSDAMYPHIVFKMRSINTGDLSRSDYILQIDVWDKSSSNLRVIDLADEVEDALKSKNLPQSGILPTFYTDNRTDVDDDDKSIKHIQIDIVVQLYERK